MQMLAGHQDSLTAIKEVQKKNQIIEMCFTFHSSVLLWALQLNYSFSSYTLAWILQIAENITWYR